jgi:hypothetical protein
MGGVSERQSSWNSLSSGYYFLVDGKLVVSLYYWSI